MAVNFALQDWQAADLRLSFRSTLPSQRHPARIAAKMIGYIAGYIARHWRGQLPLTQSFGLGALVMVPFALWFALSANAIASHVGSNPSRLILTVALPFTLFVLADIWGAVGIWRCASKYNKFARPIAAWAARTAQAAVVTNFVVLVAATVMFGSQLRAIGESARATAPAYEVTLRGNTAVFHGRLSQAAAGELELLLGDKSVKRLAIADSSGGETRAALPLAKLIRTRKLFVVALATCDAACIFMLAAGDVRAVLPQTRLQFGNGIDTNVYRQAGLIGMPFDALHAKRPGGQFTPSLRMLIADGFVTSMFVVANRRYMRATEWCVKNPVACNRTAGQNAGAHETRGGG
jgi:hypothetical protein